MTELDNELFVAPEGEVDRAGLKGWERPKSAYEKFIVEEDIPVYDGIIGVHNIRELDLRPWARLGGNGAFLYLDSLEGIKGMYVLEIPHAQTTNPERHLYHEFYLVFEGYGVTETWTTDENDKRTFEWGPGSLFYFPPNVNHRLINSGTERVLILATTNAPPIYNTIRDRKFIFENDYLFPAHYDNGDDFWKPDEKLYRVPGNKRAQARTNFYSDIINVDLPLDNQRVPGYRRIQPGFRGFEEDHNGFISQYPIGRYSRGHYHQAGAVLVCLRGGGYTFNWPREYGLTPWKDGHADKVKVLEYEQGGLVAAAPGGGDWFHQHFPVSRDNFRVINYWGGPAAYNANDSLNHATGKSGNLNIEEGGRSIGYSKEDPYIRQQFESRLAALGQKSAMPPELYTKD